MPELRIRNFGPIRNGYSENDGFMKISPVTVFIGNQATGKSTVAKLFSTFSWLEKALFREDYTKTQLENEHDFAEEFLAYHNIEKYINDDSEIDFKGSVFNFSLRNKRLGIEKLTDYYHRPQIIYVPAERNLCSISKNARRASGLPRNVFGFTDEYENANDFFSDKDIGLPFGNLKTRYDSNSRRRFVSDGKNYEIEIKNASSGIQSVVPMLLVENYLNELIDENVKKDFKTEKLSKEDLDKIKNNYKSQIEKLDENINQNLVFAQLNVNNPWAYNYYCQNGYINSFEKNNVQQELSDIQEKIVKTLENGVTSIINSCLLSIIEEPELNLFPESQMSVLFELLKIKNSKKHNTIFITTHSPYVISDLALSIKAFDLEKKGVSKDEINEIVPTGSLLDGKDCVVYETAADGVIRKLQTYGAGIPSDNNLLNKGLEVSNKKFDRLLDLQEKLYD